MNKSTNEKTKIEYGKFTINDRALYNVLVASQPINKLLENNQIVNFKSSNERDKQYFKLQLSNNSNLKYTIEGNMLKHNNGRNIVYTLTDPDNNSVIGIYVNKSTVIKENIILNEVTQIYKTMDKSEAKYVNISVNNYPCSPDEKIIINPHSQIYRLYTSGQIDINTFCNLVFFQAEKNKNTEITENSSFGVTKRLNKNFNEK